MLRFAKMVSSELRCHGFECIPRGLQTTGSNNKNRPAEGTHSEAGLNLSLRVTECPLALGGFNGEEIIALPA